MKLYSTYIILPIFALCALKGASAQDTPPQDLYCGDQNCYDGKGKFSIQLLIKTINVLETSNVN